LKKNISYTGEECYLGFHTDHDISAVIACRTQSTNVEEEGWPMAPDLSRQSVG